MIVSLVITILVLLAAIGWCLAWRYRIESRDYLQIARNNREEADHYYRENLALRAKKSQELDPC